MAPVLAFRFRGIPGRVRQTSIREETDGRFSVVVDYTCLRAGEKCDGCCTWLTFDSEKTAEFGANLFPADSPVRVHLHSEPRVTRPGMDTWEMWLAMAGFGAFLATAGWALSFGLEALMRMVWVTATLAVTVYALRVAWRLTRLRRLGDDDDDDSGGHRPRRTPPPAPRNTLRPIFSTRMTPAMAVSRRTQREHLN